MGGITVLVADDHPLVLDSLTRVVASDPRLSLIGTAVDGQQALDAIRELRPQVAILDQRMPAINGTELVATIRHERLPTRLILLSGDLDPPAASHAIELGAAGVLLKTSSPDVVIGAIVAVANGETVVAKELRD